MMTYTIITATPWGVNLGARDKYAITSRRTVATLDEARWCVAQEIHGLNDGRDERKRVDRAITEKGGTIGPLPDGSMIEVRPEEETS